MMNGKLKLAAMCAIAATMFAGCEKSAETTLKSVADTRPRVKTCVVRTKKFAETAFVQGTVRAKTSAAVAARVPGVIDALLAKEGDAVEAGAALFDVDRVNLENAVRAAEDDIRLATAALAQAEAADGKARADLARMERLVKAGAVTVDSAEKAQLGGKTAAAQLLGAKAQLTKAETGLAVAKKNLADSKVRAPFTGTVVKKVKDVGDYVGPGTPVLLMEDSGPCEVRFSLDASRYADVKVGETRIGGGTVAATAPLFDCVKIDTTAVLWWDGGHKLPANNYSRK